MAKLTDAKFPFTSGLPAVVSKPKFPCPGKLPVKKEVNYGTAQSRKPPVAAK